MTDIQRTLRIKRPAKRTMVDGTYTVRAYWDGEPRMSSRIVRVEEGVAKNWFGDELDLSTQNWLRDHHILTHA